jgi:predicted glycoside hydrolase/deacetylase ChbG (UPF0249 family)
MKKRIVLCADDYGQALAISQGILNLLDKKRLSATSCIVNSPYWEEHSQWLKPFSSDADIGLHLNLTEGKPLSALYAQQYGEYFQPLSTLLCRALMRQLSLKVIEAECNAQLDQFQKKMGFLPNYLDGHHHVHQFPVIRDAVLKVYKERLQGTGSYIRLVQTVSAPVCVKKLIIKAATQPHAFKKRLQRIKCPYNQTFNGIYTFSYASQYPQFFLEFLKKSSEGGLIMCHPSLPSSESLGGIGEARVMEYQYLMSDAFLRDCENQAVAVGRFKLTSR